MSSAIGNFEFSEINYTETLECEIERYFNEDRLNQLAPLLSDIVRSLVVLYNIIGFFIGTSLNVLLIALVIKFKNYTLHYKFLSHFTSGYCRSVAFCLWFSNCSSKHDCKALGI